MSKRKLSAPREEPPPDTCCHPCQALKYSGNTEKARHHLPGLWKEPWTSDWDMSSLGGPEQVIEPPRQSFPICRVGIITPPVLLT